MKHNFWLFLTILLMLIIGCKPKYGVHEVVDVSQKSKTLDATYVTYLLAQIEDDPEVSDNYVKLTDIYTDQGKTDEAITVLQKAVEETNNSINVLVALGKLYLEKGDASNLSGVLKELRKADPDNIDFLQLSAGYSILLEDYTNTIFFANRAMLANPYDDKNIYLLASAKLINKDSISAYQAFVEAYKLKNSQKNFIKVFELSLALDKADVAKNYLTEFESMNQDYNSCYPWGAYYNAIGQKDSAKSILKNCLGNFPKEQKIDFELARSYFPVETDSVLFYINQYLTNMPRDINALVFKAKTLELISYYTEAKKIYESAIELDSTSTLAINGLSNLERKVAYLRLVKRKENIQKDLDILKPLDSKEIN